MISFPQARNCSIVPGSWRRPAAATDFLIPNYFTRVARVPEEEKLHLAFFGDWLAMPDIYQRDHRGGEKRYSGGEDGPSATGSCRAGPLPRP